MRKVTANRLPFNTPFQWRMNISQPITVYKIYSFEEVCADGVIMRLVQKKSVSNIDLLDPDSLAGEHMLRIGWITPPLIKNHKVFDQELFSWDGRLWTYATSGGAPYCKDGRWLLYEIEVVDPQLLAERLTQY